MPKVLEPVPCITLDVSTAQQLSRGKGTPQHWGDLGVTSSSHTPGAVAHLPVSPHAQFPQSVEGQLTLSTRK